MPHTVISQELLKILVCPICKRAVKLKGKELVCVKCGRRFPVVRGVPNMLPDELR
ncbi:MAG TPA: Trm112 family protein [Hadesarchaea archaeon]|nr:Trm112 family protein [Hadesarchaea archaeon]